MRINHNIAALNTYRQFNNANNAQSKSMEKLSSGLRINSAADDAAGLAISEKMRGQIRGLDMASKNAQDGVSLIQTAEGALTETHDILQRMKELATQAANDTNTTDDRGEIQKEINQLTSEVNRIANTTEFNTKKVLDGGKTAAATPAGGAAGAASGVNAKADAQTVGGTNTFSFDLGTAGAKGNFDIQFTTGGAAGAAFDATGKTLTVTLDQTNSAVTADDVQALIRNATTNKPADLDLSKFTVSADGTDVIDATGPVDEKVSLTGGEDTPTASSAGSFTTQAGVSNGTDNSSIESALDVSTHDNATNAIDVLDKAIAKVSGERSKLGAYQNRLDHTINNLNTSSENLTAAESRIRDVDYALAA